MRKTVATAILSAVLLAALASPALASTGREFGEHHSAHAIEQTGFTGDHNPGVHHQGFSNWMAH